MGNNARLPACCQMSRKLTALTDGLQHAFLGQISLRQPSPDSPMQPASLQLAQKCQNQALARNFLPLPPVFGILCGDPDSEWPILLLCPLELVSSWAIQLP